MTLDVFLGGSAGPSGLQWDLGYPVGDVAFDSASVGPAAATKSIECFGTGGSTTCVLFGLNTDILADGVVAHLGLRILPGTVATSASIQLTNISAVAPAGSRILSSGTGAQITIQQPVNSPPVATDQNVLTTEDTALGITLSGTDPDGDTLTFNVATPPTNGTLSGTAPNLTYTPATNFQGVDSFTFTADDGNGGSDTGTVNITVTPENDDPVATDQNVLTTEDTALGITLSGTDPDGDTLTFNVATPPTNGTLSGTAPNLTYTPNSGFAGQDSFEFQANDGSEGIDTATVFISVLIDDRDAFLAITTPEDAAVSITLDDGLAKGQDLTFTHEPPSHGYLTGTGPVLTYTPAPNYHGPDGFKFAFSDANGTGDHGTVSITVTPENDAPVAQAQSFTTQVDVATAVTLHGDDIDGDILAFTHAAPSHGSISGSGASLTYTPTNGFIGTDSFTFAVDDGNGGSHSATVTLTVQEAEALAITYLSCGGSFAGGGTRSCQAKISEPAPVSGLTVNISVDSSQISAPSSIHIAPGSTSGSFKLSSSVITVQETLEITASLGAGKDATADLNLIPLRPSSLSCTPGQITPGDTTTCRVGLNSSGFAVGLSLAVSSNSSALEVPSSISVQPGQSSTSFQAPSDKSAAQQTAVVTVNLHGSDVSDTVVIGASSGPVISVESTQIVEVGNELTFEVTAEDPRGLNLTLSAAALPPGAAFDTSASRGADCKVGQFSWVPSAEQVGTHLVTFRAENTAGQRVDRVVTIHVLGGAIEITALSNAASFSTDMACSPGSLATLWGFGFTHGSSEVATSFPLPTVLNNIRVLMNDELARLIYVSPTQINLQCPLLATDRTLQIRVERVGGEKESVSSTSETLGRFVRNVAPGIFALDGSGSGQGMIVIANTNKLAMLTHPDIPSRPAIPGNHLTIFATGLGPVDNDVAVGEPASADPLSRAVSNVRVKVGFVYVQVTFAGLAPGFVGLHQVNVRLFENINTGPEVPVKLEVQLDDGTVLESNEVTITIERPD